MKKNNDLAFEALLENECVDEDSALWFIEENWKSQFLPQNGNCQLISNRIDIQKQLTEFKYNCIFNDFNIENLEPVQHCYIRISKEKFLTHHLINCAKKILKPNGIIFIAGFEQEGIKSFIKRCEENHFIIVNKRKIKKGAFHFSLKISEQTTDLDDNHYHNLRSIDEQESIFSKPGVFGWNKIDEGSLLLIETLKTHFRKPPASILDLGCGYGFLTIKAKEIFPEALITATDNNAAAIIACQKNCDSLQGIHVIADDCAATITEKFKLVICNPPFHQGFNTEDKLTHQFLKSAAARLKNKGSAIFVVNSFITIEKKIPDYFYNFKCIASNNKFKVIECWK